MVLPTLIPTYTAFGTIDLLYTMPGDDTSLKATATSSATGSTQTDAFAALEKAAADAVESAVPANAIIKGYNICNTGIKVVYAPPSVVPIIPAVYNAHPVLNLTGALGSSNATTGAQLLAVDPEIGTVAVGAALVDGTYVGNYATSNGNNATPQLGVAGSRFPNAVFKRTKDATAGDSSDIKNYTTYGGRRQTDKYTIAETVPASAAGFGAFFGPDSNYEVQDKTGNTWELGNTSFGVEGLDANANPLGAFSVNMVSLDGNNKPIETCNFRVKNDGTTCVKGLNFDGKNVVVDPATGYLKVATGAEV
uniref:Uncharacterized protein n=1 Tax=viral metagenome TaxID=1070528 RepID=A0A6C0EH79_9ZZZZ